MGWLSGLASWRFSSTAMCAERSACCASCGQGKRGQEGEQGVNACTQQTAPTGSVGSVHCTLRGPAAVLPAQRASAGTAAAAAAAAFSARVLPGGHPPLHAPGAV